MNIAQRPNDDTRQLAIKLAAAMFMYPAWEGTDSEAIGEEAYEEATKILRGIDAAERAARTAFFERDAEYEEAKRAIREDG